MTLPRLFGACALAASLASAIVLPHAMLAATPQTIAVADENYARVPTSLTAGIVNVVTTTHQTNPNLTDAVDMARLNTVQAKSKVAAGMGKGISGVLPYITLVGGVDQMPRASRAATFDLSAGTYVVFDLNALTASKNPHSPYKFFTVTGSGSGAPPASAATVRLIDFKFQVPTGLPGGVSTVRLVNTSHEPHEMNLAKVAQGKTMADVKAALMSNASPKWVTEIGGWGVISPGQTEWAHLNLTPGNYLLACWVPDMFSYPGHKATNKPHAMLGMMKMISVK